MKTQLNIIIALLALIVLYYYVPALFMFWPVIIDNFTTVMAFISFGVVAAIWLKRQLKAEHHG